MFTVDFPFTLGQAPIGPAASVTVNILNLQHATLTDSVAFSFLFGLSIVYPAVSGQVVETTEVPYAGSVAVPGTVAGMRGKMGIEITGACFNTASSMVSVAFAVTVTTKSTPPPGELDGDIGII